MGPEEFKPCAVLTGVLMPAARQLNQNCLGSQKSNLKNIRPEFKPCTVLKGVLMRGLDYEFPRYTQPPHAKKGKPQDA